VSTASRGAGRERQVVRLLQANGWFAMRAPASLGVADVVALRRPPCPVFGEARGTSECEVCGGFILACPIYSRGEIDRLRTSGVAATEVVLSESRLIEVKTTATRGPWNDFGPAARRALSEAARLAGATAWLYHWPTGGQLRVIPEAEWPT
jgi:hypothetical protein